MKLKNLLALLALGLCWGPSFSYAKIALRELPPYTLISFRLLIAASFLLVILKIKGIRLLDYKQHFRHFLVMGFIAVALPFSLITSGQRFIPSALSGIVNGSTPIFTLIIAHFCLPTEKITPNKLIGVLVGFSGILFIFLPALIRNFDKSLLANASLVLLASLCYGIGMVYAKKNLSDVPSLIAPTWQVLTAFLMVLPLAVFREEFFLLPQPSLKTVLNVSALGLFSTSFAFIIYYYLVKNAGAAYLSTSTLLFPIVALILGVTLLKETLHWNAYLGCGLILCGLFIANFLRMPQKLLAKQEQSTNRDE